MASELLSTSEACALLGVDRSTLWRWERSGRVARVSTDGNRPRWDRAELEALEGGTSDGAAAPAPPVVEDERLGEIAVELSEHLDSGGAGDRFDRVTLELLAEAAKRRQLARLEVGLDVPISEIRRIFEMELKLEHIRIVERIRDLTRGRV